jgi:hypothetical protein
MVFFARANAAAKDTVQVVFPIPPFWLAIAMMCMIILSLFKIAWMDERRITVSR